jgi:hypothetical protein
VPKILSRISITLLSVALRRELSTSFTISLIYFYNIIPENNGVVQPVSEIFLFLQETMRSRRDERLSTA